MSYFLILFSIPRSLGHMKKAMTLRINTLQSRFDKSLQCIKASELCVYKTLGATEI